MVNIHRPPRRREGQSLCNAYFGKATTMNRDRTDHSKQQSYTGSAGVVYNGHMRNLAAIVLSMMLALSPAPVSAQAVNFTLINNTDIAFTGLMVRRFGTQQWSPLVVSPTPVTSSGGRGAVAFSNPDCAFDLQATLPDGRVVVWPRVNLCDARLVTLNRGADGSLWVDYD